MCRRFSTFAKNFRSALMCLPTSALLDRREVLWYASAWSGSHHLSIHIVCLNASACFRNLFGVGTIVRSKTKLVFWTRVYSTNLPSTIKSHRDTRCVALRIPRFFMRFFSSLWQDYALIDCRYKEDRAVVDRVMKRERRAQQVWAPHRVLRQVYLSKSPFTAS